MLISLVCPRNCYEGQIHIKFSAIILLLPPVGWNYTHTLQVFFSSCFCSYLKQIGLLPSMESNDMGFLSVSCESVLLPLGNKEATSTYGRSTYNPALLQTLNNPVASAFQYFCLYFQALGFFFFNHVPPCLACVCCKVS